MTEFKSEHDRTYWRAFEQRLMTLPHTALNTTARRSLIAAAYSDMTTRHPYAPTAAEHAERAYRLRFVLGPTLSDRTHEDLAREQIEAAAELLADGVGLELLGIAGGHARR